MSCSAASFNSALVYPTLATGAALLVYSYQAMTVGEKRKQHRVKPPATTGHPEFERAFRAHQNTLESLAVFVPSVYAFSYLVSPRWAGIIGSVYAASRLAYGIAYVREADSRSYPFLGSFIAQNVLLLGAVGSALRLTYLHCRS
ncbi:MAPEG domain-containing protein [Balamuthia mandrillaris]